MYQAIGIILAAVLLAGIRGMGRSLRRPLAIALVSAALIYVAFAVVAHASPRQLIVEMLGVLVYGALAWFGMRRSMGWLAAGWALHPAWDIGLHLLGPSAGIAPAGYAHLCLTFDLVVAAYLALCIRRQRADASFKLRPRRV